MNWYWKLQKKLDSSRKNEGSANSIRLSVQEIPHNDLFWTSYIIFIISVNLCNLIMSLSRHHFKCPKMSFWFCVFHELFFTSKSKFTCWTSRAMKYCHEKISFFLQFLPYKWAIIWRRRHFEILKIFFFILFDPWNWYEK